MYKCPCKTVESLDLMKRTIFDKNQFMTCYLIFNFRPTFFSYFWKITADSVFHNVKKQVGQKWPFPVVKGLRVKLILNFRHEYDLYHFARQLFNERMKDLKLERYQREEF